MNTCYKCGREIPFGTECEAECEESPRIFTQAEIAQMIQDYERNTVSIDWDKVQTVADLKQIVRTMLCEDRVARGSIAYHELRKYLKEKNPHD